MNRIDRLDLPRNLEQVNNMMSKAAADWADVYDNYELGNRWMRVNGHISRDAELRMRQQLEAVDQLLRTVAELVEQMWRSDYP
jgi:hypothetical protein